MLAMAVGIKKAVFHWYTGPQTSICYILQGTGKLTLKGGEPLDYKPNYCIILGPDTLHGWENDNEVTAMLVVSVP